jgi:hypothetical protein
LLAQLSLDPFPNGEGGAELFTSGARHSDPALAPVFATAFSDPSFAQHDGEGAGEAGAVHGEDLAEFSLCEFAGVRDYLKDCELG